MYINDPQFGNIVDFDQLRQSILHLYNALLPDFDMHKSLQVGAELYGDEPDVMIAAGASMLAWMTIIAAGEDEIAEELKDSLFTLGWTEEEIGSDLLSASTAATPVNDDPDCVDYHLKGRKWLINNSYHADYHTIVAKTEPDSSGPRSLSIFLVPQSSCKNWQRLETHVLRRMVLTSFDIDGPGRLLGKAGHGLHILQRMAMPSKYQCAYVGINLLNEAIPASIEHLSKKRIFNENPINFSNVLRQMYNIVMQAAVLNFIYYRALALSASNFLQFHGVMLKSWLLLRANELLGQNLLVVGSKGFLAESVIGRNAIDSFVLPVFDGHYTINTLMTAKHAKRYLGASRRADVAERLATLRFGLSASRGGDPIRANSRVLRNPDFFDFAQYIEDLALPIDLNARQLVARMQSLTDELNDRDLSTDPEHRYKLGALLHWMEALLARLRVVEGDRRRRVSQRRPYAAQRLRQPIQPGHQRERPANRLPAAHAPGSAAQNQGAARIPPAPLQTGAAIFVSGHSTPSRSHFLRHSTPSRSPFPEASGKGSLRRGGAAFNPSPSDSLVAACILFLTFAGFEGFFFTDDFKMGEQLFFGAFPGRFVVDHAVVDEFPADDLFGHERGQHFVELLDAVEDAAEGEAAAVDIGFVGSKILGQVFGVLHQGVADFAEVAVVIGWFIVVFEGIGI